MTDDPRSRHEAIVERAMGIPVVSATAHQRMAPTYCRDCDLVHGDTRKQEPWRWRCLAEPVPPGFGFVDPSYSPTPPYALCRFVNDGHCEHFTKRREPEKVE